MQHKHIYPKLIIDALKTVRYPGTGKNIVEMNMLHEDIKIAGLSLSITIIFERETDPFRKSIIKAAQAAIHAYVGKEIEVEINTQIQKKTTEQNNEPLLPNIKNIIAISSGKGGVGKSTIAANLSVMLQQMGYKVGLLDCDIFGPSQPKMFHTEDARPYSEEFENNKEKIIPIEQYGIKMLSIGYFVSPQQATIWRGSMASNALKQLITETHWQELDFLLLDTPPGTSDIHLTLVQTLPISGAIIVSTPQQIALADAIKGINMYQNEKINVPILGIVENMAYFTPEKHPHEKYYIFGKEGAKKLAQQMNIPLLAQIPLVQDIQEAADNGIPAALNPLNPQYQAFEQMAKNILQALEKRNQEQPPTQTVKITH